MVIEAPAWGLLTIGFLWTLAFCWTFDKVWRQTIGAAFKRLADIGFGGVHGVGAVHPLRFLKKVNEAVESWTARGMQASERGVVYSLNKVIDTGALLFGVPLAIALSLYELAQFAAHHAGRAVTRVEHSTVVKKVTTTIKGAATITKVQFNHLTARVATLEHKIAKALHATAGAIATPFPRLGRLEKTAKTQAKRLTKIEKALAVGASAALVWTALRKLGLKWLRCGNVNKTGKALCGMNPSVLDALLLNAALLTVTFDLEDFAREMQDVTEEAARLIHNWAT